MWQIQLPQLSLLTNFRQHLQPLAYLKYLFLIVKPVSAARSSQTFVKCENCSIPPLLKWPCQTLCPNVKDDLKKITLGSIESRLGRLLSRYRVTPQSTTRVSPVELMFERKLRTRLDLLQPDLEEWVRHQQAKQKQNHDAHAKHRAFEVSMVVYVLNNHGTPKWLPEIIQQIPASVLVII